jgi:hypothetical protein
MRVRISSNDDSALWPLKMSRRLNSCFNAPLICPVNQGLRDLAAIWSVFNKQFIHVISQENDCVASNVCSLQRMLQLFCRVQKCTHKHQIFFFDAVGRSSFIDVID